MEWAASLKTWNVPKTPHHHPARPVGIIWCCFLPLAPARTRLVLMAVPFSLVGGILALIRHINLSVSAAVGFISCPASRS